MTICAGELIFAGPQTSPCAASAQIAATLSKSIPRTAVQGGIGAHHRLAGTFAAEWDVGQPVPCQCRGPATPDEEKEGQWGDDPEEKLQYSEICTRCLRSPDQPAGPTPPALFQCCH